METKPAISIDCPRCPARAGDPCQDRSGRVRGDHAIRTRNATPRPVYRAADAPPKPERSPRPSVNFQAFTCPRCGIWSDQFTTKITRDRDEWVHAHCVTGPKKSVVRTAMAASSDPDHCATCGGPLHAGNRGVSSHGDIIHANGCPRRQVKNRRTPPT
jgi:predicted RNA-binding Zn-ribbon protein involved in translation (DUF1610 family)